MQVEGAEKARSITFGDAKKGQAVGNGLIKDASGANQQDVDRSGKFSGSCGGQSQCWPHYGYL